MSGKRQKENKTLDRVLALVGLLLVAFIVTMIVTFYIKGSTPDTLIQYVLGAGTVELFLTACITIAKTRAGMKSKKEDDEL